MPETVLPTEPGARVVWMNPQQRTDLIGSLVNLAERAGIKGRPKPRVENCVLADWYQCAYGYQQLQNTRFAPVTASGHGTRYYRCMTIELPQAHLTVIWCDRCKRAINTNDDREHFHAEQCGGCRKYERIDSDCG